jgi:hypothetical protein
MSADLTDLRAKITVEAHCALAAYARAHEIDRSELVREILHKWAMKQIHGASLLANCLRAKGVTGADEGTSGKAGDSLDWADE